MRVEQYLKKKAEEDLKALGTERDREVLQRLKELIVGQDPAAPKDYCLTCRLPASKCKGNCTLEERKRNGG